MTLSIIFSAASLILCCFFFIFFRVYIRRRTGREDIFSGYRDEVNRLIAAIDAATDRDSQLVEERITALRKLLEETDKRLAVYVREFENRKNSEALYTRLGRNAGLNKTVTEDGPSAGQNSASIPAAAGPAAPQTELFSAAAPEKTNPENPPAQVSFREQVAGLAASGLSAAQIAARLAVSVSEVDLALSLLGRR
ncbi:MAG: hypothetical protein LBN21_11520 [Treponema sp.]|jgi:DNA-binding NarL/FixJ family response regulator|nr:hypothetical protein [Treponema sp.]